MQPKLRHTIFANPGIKIFAITWLTYAGFYFCRKNFSIAMPLLAADESWSHYDFAFEIGFYSLMYMAGQFLSGMAADRYGARIVMGIGIIGIVLANTLMGFSNTTIFFALLMAMNGLFQSTGWSGSIKLLTPWTSEKKRGIIMSWWTTCYVAGGFLAVVFATWWASNQTILSTLSWRRVFWAPAFLLLLLVPAFFIIVKKTTVHSPTPADSKASRAIAWTAVKKNLSISTLWIAALMYFTIKLIRYTFLFWLPLYLSQSHHYNTSDAGYTSSVFELAGFAGILAAGYASDRIFSSRRFPVTVIMMFTLALVFVFQKEIASLGTWGMILLIGFSGFLLYGPDSLISGATAMDIGDKDAAGFAAGFINGIGSLGQLISPFVTAFIIERYGWDTLFILFFFLAVISAVLLIAKWNFKQAPAIQIPRELKPRPL